MCLFCIYSGGSVENRAETLIFYEAVCFGMKINSFDGRKEMRVKICLAGQ